MYLLASDKVNLVGSYHFRVQPKDGAFAIHGTIERENKCQKKKKKKKAKTATGLVHHIISQLSIPL
jgi:hypothetical protein